MATPTFTNFNDILGFTNTITGGLWGVSICIALGAIATFSLYFEYKEKAFVGGGLIMLTIGALLSFANLINPMWVLLFLAYTSLMLIIARRSSRE